MHQSKLALLAAGMSLALYGCSQGPVDKDAGNETTAEANAASADHKDPVESAMAAAPAAIAQDATIVQAQADGTMKTIREGKNGWTCMPDSPTTPGPDPMCMDANAAKWAAAWIGHKDPPANTAGVMYMLEGGTDASNTDPYAAAPTADNHWIQTGPHFMIVGAADEFYAAYPSGPDPQTDAPYVMWAGTPYQHLMAPIK